MMRAQYIVIVGPGVDDKQNDTVNLTNCVPSVALRVRVGLRKSQRIG